MKQLATGREQEGLMPESMVTSKAGMLRLAVGLLQGLALYFLYFAAKSKTWPATEHFIFAPLLLVCLITPILLISCIGHMGRIRTAAWVTAAACLAFSLGWYDVWRVDTVAAIGARANNQSVIRYPSSLLVFFLCAGFFIAHSLVLAAAQEGRRAASYAMHFETSWKLAIQLLFSSMFVGALWAALWLGALLFMLVKLSFLKELLQHSWFAIPVTTFGYACAMHLTDVRPALVRGIRSLLLMLLSWLLPVSTLIVLGFLASLPLTGLQPLWATKTATAVLLGAAAALVILINAAYQNGELSSSIARVIRVSVKVAALALVPIVAIAVHALSLRVNEYGWTTDRIIAAACLLVAASYAIGYAWSAFRRPSWMGLVANVNLFTAYMILAVLLALFSPAADPARLSVNDQLARLRNGLVKAAEFDFQYLRFHGARYGQAALDRFGKLTEGADAQVLRRGAENVLAQTYPGERHTVSANAEEVGINLSAWPKGETLPASFLKQDWKTYKRNWELPACLRQPKNACDAFLIDFNSDGRKDILLLPTQKHGQAVVMTEKAGGQWFLFARLPSALSKCEPLRNKLMAGEYAPVSSRLNDLEIGGMRIETGRQSQEEEFDCPAS